MSTTPAEAGNRTSTGEGGCGRHVLGSRSQCSDASDGDGLPIVPPRHLSRPRLTDNPYVYWGSLAAATSLLAGCLYAAATEVVYVLWRTDPFHR